MPNQSNLIESKSTIKECKFESNCSKEPRGIRCEADYCVNGKVLFVKPTKENFTCSHLNNYGSSHYCTCPNRMLTFLETKK